MDRIYKRRVKIFKKFVYKKPSCPSSGTQAFVQRGIYRKFSGAYHLKHLP